MKLNPVIAKKLNLPLVDTLTPKLMKTYALRLDTGIIEGNFRGEKLELAKHYRRHWAYHARKAGETVNLSTGEPKAQPKPRKDTKDVPEMVPVETNTTGSVTKLRRRRTLMIHSTTDPVTMSVLAQLGISLGKPLTPEQSEAFDTWLEGQKSALIKDTSLKARKAGDQVEKLLIQAAEFVINGLMTADEINIKVQEVLAQREQAAKEAAELKARKAEKQARDQAKKAQDQANELRVKAEEAAKKAEELSKAINQQQIEIVEKQAGVK